MRYMDLGADFAPHQHALVLTGTDLDDALARKLIGLTQKLNDKHPEPTYYFTGDLWKWVEATLGEKWDGRWQFSCNTHMKVVEIRFLSKQMAMQCKLLFAGTPVLIP